MIIIKITGGLGNQLFQYAFGQYLAEKLNTKVLYDIQTIQKCRNFTPRTLELTSLGIPYEVATIDDLKKMKFFLSGIGAQIERKITQNFPNLNSMYFVEKLLHRKINFKYERDNCYYDGYWQSFKYLEPRERQLRNQISINNLTTKLNDITNEIKCVNSVSIHIRRADYISIKKNVEIFHVCSKEYYDYAIAYFKEKCADSKFYIFSDDIEWARNNFFGNQFSFMTGNKPAEDLILMSSCKNHIIANSTFSWWAAWLNPSKEKIVIAPKNWYVGTLNESTIDLMPNDWIRM